MAKETGKEKAVEQAEQSTGRTADELVESGWDHYSKKEFFKAEADFKKALEDTPDNADTMYALAMTQQASGQTPEAIQSFENVILLLEKTKDKEPVRALMLTRLAHGHISRMKTGDWKLEG